LITEGLNVKDYLNFYPAMKYYHSHFKLEKAIIAPPVSTASASEVSVISRDKNISLSSPTYR